MVVEFDISSGIVYEPLHPTSGVVLPTTTIDGHAVDLGLAVVDSTPYIPEVDCE